MIKIKHLFANLSERERKLIIIAGLVATIMLGISFLKNMPNLLQQSLRVQVENNRQDFEEILPKIAKLKKLKQLRHNYQKISDADLYEFIQNNLPQLNVYKKDEIVIIKQEEKVEIKYKAVSFDDLILWLERLHKQYGVTIVYADISMVTEKTGYVSARLVLQ